MCRLYGQLSPAARSARDFLADSERSLLRQSDHRPGSLQKDGWGFGYFIKENKARVVKSPKPAFEEAARFKSLASVIRSRAVIGHLRAASNPRGLSRRSLLGVENSQPFTDGRLVFAHNGTIAIPLEIARFLGPYRGRVRGVNDSEVYFWQFRKFFDVFRDIPEALEACIRELWSIWKACRTRYPGKKAPFAGLNTLVSDGRSLHALCHYASRPGQTSFFNPRQGWGTMSLGRRDGRVILASEDMDSGAWRHLRQPEIVSAVLTPAGLSVSRRRLRAGVS